MNNSIMTEAIVQAMPVPVISKEKLLPMKDNTVSTIPESNKNIVKAKKTKPRIAKIIIGTSFLEEIIFFYMVNNLLYIYYTEKCWFCQNL